MALAGVASLPMRSRLKAGTSVGQVRTGRFIFEITALAVMPEMAGITKTTVWPVLRDARGVRLSEHPS